MIAYWIKLTLLSGLNKLKQLPNLITEIIILLVVFFYAFILSDFTNLALSDNKKLNISSEKIVYFLSLFFFTITFLKIIIPTYKPQRRLFPDHYPLSINQHYLLSLSKDFSSSYFLHCYLFTVIYISKLESNQVKYFLYISESIILAHLFRRLLQYLFDYTIKTKAFFIGISIITIVITCSCLFRNVIIDNYISSSFFLIILFTCIGFLFEKSILNNKKKQTSKLISNKFLKSIFFIPFNNNTAKSTLLIALLFKLLIIIFECFVYKYQGKHIFDGTMIYWLIFSPFVLFSYVYNNMWGFYKSVWLSVELRSGNYKDIIITGLKTLLLPILIDCAMTLPILLFIWGNYFNLISFYITGIFLLISLSMLWSILFPINIVKVMQWRGTTSYISTFLTAVCFIAFSFLIHSKWLFLLEILYVIISFAAIFTSLSLYKERKHYIFTKLYKQT